MLKNMINSLVFKMPSAKTIAQTDMEEAERQMLKHEADALYHTKMKEYYELTFQRLSKYIARPVK